MNESQKPFACASRGCEMTFTNEDHLNWHQKKHDMMLNLGLANKNNEVADQTPTPTRFIRNCEEVGLFQDLQNVNPFDEFFKKAVEVAKTGGTLEVPETQSDDTLHTPHILPHIEQNQKNINKSNTSRDDNSQSNEFSLNVVTVTNKKNTTDNNAMEHSPSPIIVVNDESDDETNVKKKIKEALLTKEKQKNDKENSNSSDSSVKITLVPFQNLAIVKENPNKSRNNKTKRDSLSTEDSKEKLREMNRAAQLRCRKRKQIRWKEMEEEIKTLKKENKRLRMENYSLQVQNIQLKENTLNANADTVLGTVIGTLVPATENTKVLKKAPTAPKSTKYSNISPSKIENSQNSIVIQILPNDCNIAIPVLPSEEPNSIQIHDVPSVVNSTFNLEIQPELMKAKRKGLRRIVPKIIIEN